MADLFTHQLWVNKKGDLNGQILSLQFTNTEAKMNLDKIIKMWTQRGYEYVYETIYNYCPDECRTRDDIKLDVDLSDGIVDNDSIIQRKPVNESQVPAKTNRIKRKANKMAATKHYTVGGKARSLKEISADFKINIGTLRARVARGVKGDALVATSVHGGSLRAKKFSVPMDGKTKEMTLKEIAKMAESPVATIRARVARGLQGMNLVTGYNPLNVNRGRAYSVQDGSMNLKLTVNEIAEKYSISPATVRARIKKGYSPVEIIKGKAKAPKKVTSKAPGKTVTLPSKKETKVTMTADELIAGLEKERDEYVADKQALENEVVNADLEETSIAA
tara:strand:+ start:1692 stop:2690 length:999 start_codon:yes stop_codon:yes gene_type:complete